MKRNEILALALIGLIHLLNHQVRITAHFQTYAIVIFHAFEIDRNLPRFTKSTYETLILGDIIGCPSSQILSHLHSLSTKRSTFLLCRNLNMSSSPCCTWISPRATVKVNINRYARIKADTLTFGRSLFRSISLIGICFRRRRSRICNDKFLSLGFGMETFEPSTAKSFCLTTNTRESC
jgi:hypothetical protein